MPPQLFLLLIVAGWSQIHAWSYSDSEKPEGWAGICTDGQRQSPIDLVTENAQRFVVEPLEFFNYRSLNGTITNNGHSVAIHFDEDNCDSGVTGGNLRSMYLLHEMHFHWESEHTVDGRRSPLELHMVHYNTRYSSLKQASHQPDGLAVIGVLFRDSENGTEVLDSLLEAVKGVSPTVQAKGRLPLKFNPIEFLPADNSTFFRYSGSLTTPPCSESVTWTVMEDKVPVSKEQGHSFDYPYKKSPQREFGWYLHGQMKIFKLVSTDKGILENNYRRLQDINERDVYLLTDNGGSSVTSALALILISFFTVFIVKD